MKKEYFVFLLGLFLISFASASISLSNDLNALYNLGDKVELNLKIVPEPEISDLVTLKMVCGGIETEIYKEFLFIDVETEKKIIVPLVKNFIGNSVGDCEIKYFLGDEEGLITSDLVISNSIKISLDENGVEFSPGDSFLVSGNALRENGKSVNGKINARILDLEGNGEIFASGNVSEGNFAVNLVIPENYGAGEHKVNIKVYEENSKGETTNLGETTSFVLVKQVPTNIEIFLENNSIIPGNKFEFEILVHDQTGDEMVSSVFVGIRNPKNILIHSGNENSGKKLSYFVVSNETPGLFTVEASYKDLFNRRSFEVLENEDVEVQVINKTLIFTNRGNIPFNNSVPVEIGRETVLVDVSLGIGESEKYVLSAPTGEYVVKVDGVEKSVSLTGNAVEIKKYSEFFEGEISWIIWIFILFFLIFGSYLVFVKYSKRTFLGKRRNPPINHAHVKKIVKKEDSLFSPRISVDLSLSLMGHKQDVSVGCLILNNYEEIKSGEGGVKQTLGSIVSFIEQNKGLVYRSRENLFFIFAPLMTKTFENEMSLILASEKINSILELHNKKFKDKISYGVGLSYGTMVMKKEGNSVKFLSIGSFMTNLKRIAKGAKERIYLSEEMRNRVKEGVRIELKHVGNLKAYHLSEVVNKKEYSTFIKGFLERQRKS